MATYIMLGTFTDQGIRSVNETTKRADAIKELAKSLGLLSRSYTGRLGSTTPSLSSMRLTKPPLPRLDCPLAKRATTARRL
jgi:hypothetical protein